MPWDPFIGLLSNPFAAAAGWAWDTVVAGITDWLARGFIQLVSFVWMVMDRTSSPQLQSAWFSSGRGAPYLTAVGLATAVLACCVFAALIQGVLAGQPMALVRVMFLRTPTVVAGIVFTVAFAQIGIDVIDELANGVWDLTRERATRAVDGLLLTASKLPSQSFLAPLLLLVGMIGMLFLWVVLLVRSAMVYLVVALSPLAWAASVWPALAGIRRKTLELLAGLILSKLVIAIALSVGLGALGGVGIDGNPGGEMEQGFAAFGTLVSGVIVFSLAAFMPYLVIKLIPLVETAAIARSIHGAPVRAASQAMQYSYYLSNAQTRLAGDSTASITGLGQNRSTGTASNGTEIDFTSSSPSPTTPTTSSPTSPPTGRSAGRSAGSEGMTRLATSVIPTTTHAAAAPATGPIAAPTTTRASNPATGEMRSAGGERG